MMKKQLLLSLLVIISSSVLFSQNLIENNQIHDQKTSENYTPINNNSKDGGGWFNYGREIENQSTDFNLYHFVQHVDSTMISGYIDGATGDTTYYNVWHHSEGQILDPTSFNFSSTGEAEFFFAGEGFMLDTIKFPYYYFRPQTGLPDKLIVQFYTNAPSGGITEATPTWGPYQRVEYDHTTYRGLNAVQTIEYELTDNDVTPDTSAYYQIFVVDPPIEMPTGGIVAATYTFIPMNTYNLGDTVYTPDLTWIQNPRNCFRGLYFKDAMPVVDNPGYHNYNLMIKSEVQYDASSNGWNGKYIPGIAWSNSNGEIDYHQHISFHLTPIVTQPTNTSNISTGNTKLFPNPANNKVNIVFDNSNDINSIKITDLTGRTVYTEIIANNTNAITVNTRRYNPGIYFCEINGVTTVETIKFTKIK